MATIAEKVQEAEKGLAIAGRDYYMRYINMLLRSSLSDKATSAYISSASANGFVVFAVAGGDDDRHLQIREEV